MAGSPIALLAAIPPRGNEYSTSKYRSTSIPVVVPIVVVPMMVPVPPLPSIFVRVLVVAVAITAIVIRSVLWVFGANVNAKAIVCFGLGGYHGSQPERRQPNEEISFHMIPFLS
jgi:hypothetical protein